MDLSFVILTWNSERFIEACVESIFQDIGPLGLESEIFIVDNGSADRTPAIIRELVKRRRDRIRPIFLDRNLGTTRPRNMALKKTAGRLILVLDSDVQLVPGVTAGLMETIHSGPDIGLVAPGLIYPDGRHQKSVDIFPTLPHKIKRAFGLRKIERAEQEKRLPQGPIEVDYAISAFWMFRRETLKTVGLLDENIFYSPEDVDYCLRMWNAGFRILHEPRYTAIHDAQEISRGMRVNRATLNHLLGLFYFFVKHRYVFARPARCEPLQPGRV